MWLTAMFNFHLSSRLTSLHFRTWETATMSTTPNASTLLERNESPAWRLTRMTRIRTRKPIHHHHHHRRKPRARGTDPLKLRPDPILNITRTKWMMALRARSRVKLVVEEGHPHSTQLTNRNRRGKTERILPRRDIRHIILIISNTRIKGMMVLPIEGRAKQVAEDHLHYTQLMSRNLWGATDRILSQREFRPMGAVPILREEVGENMQEAKAMNL